MSTNTDKKTIVQIPVDTEVSDVAVWVEKDKTMRRIGKAAFDSGVNDAVNDVTTGDMVRDSFTGTTMTGTVGLFDTVRSKTGGGTISVSSDISTSKALLSTSSTVLSGYTTGAGGAVTQATDRSTGVTLSKPCGVITMDDDSLAAGAEVTFAVTNSLVTSTDVIILSLTNPGGTGTPFAFVSSVGDGSFAITVTNLHASTACTNATLINFVIIKSVSA